MPRKGVLELQRILGGDGEVEITIGSNHIRLQIGDIRFTSKLIDGKFPEYGRVIPASPGKIIVADRDLLRQALQRTAILSNEKYRGVRVSLAPNALKLQAHNPEQEEAQDEVEIEYTGRGAGDRLQRHLSARCLGGHRHGNRGDRSDRRQQQLPDPLAWYHQRSLRRDAHAAVSVARQRPGSPSP